MVEVAGVAGLGGVVGWSSRGGRVEEKVKGAAERST